MLAGFPHSDIRGLSLSRQLPAAFRSLTRPSSFKSGKASSVRPSLLDLIFNMLVLRFFYKNCLTLFPTFRLILLNNFSLDLLLYLLILMFVFQRSISRKIALPKSCSRLTSYSSLYFLLRKEVIHPHVPVGIPCYDLTPVIGPALDDSLPYGLCHRLRALPASMV